MPFREEFTVFAKEVEPRLRYALVAAYGTEKGLEATSEALVWAWEHWDRVRETTNPAGYLYRIASRKAWRLGKRKQPPLLQPIPEAPDPIIEPGLASALDDLSKMQRTVVILVEGLEYTQRETAELLGISTSSVQTHLKRALTRLRAALGVKSDV